MFYRIIDDEIRLELTNHNHADAIFQLVDKNRSYFRKWLNWIDANQDVSATHKFIDEAMKESLQNKQVNCCIFYKETLVGNIALLGMKNKQNDTPKGEIGYWLDHARWKKGIMHRAVKEMLKIGFTYYNLHKITIRCGTENHHSCNIPKRLGFVHDGILRDDMKVNGNYINGNIFSMLKREYESFYGEN